MNKFLCWILCTATIALQVGCEKPPAEDIQQAIDSITTDPDQVTDPIPDLSGDPTPDTPPIDPPPIDPPPIDPPPVEVNRFDFKFEVAKVWSFFEGQYKQCPGHQKIFRWSHRACFIFIGQIWAPDDYSIEKIKFTKNVVNIYWGNENHQVIDSLEFNSNKTYIDLTTTEKDVDEQPNGPIGNMWMLIPMIFQNNPVETFEGRIAWSPHERLLVFKAADNSIKIFSY